MELDYKEAAKAMIDGEICVDKDGSKWRYNDKKGAFEYNDKEAGWLRYNPNQHLEPFTIKKKPVKYSVDVWLEREPQKKKDADYLGYYLTGMNFSWSREPTPGHKQYRITVEEIEE